MLKEGSLCILILASFSSGACRCGTVAHAKSSHLRSFPEYVGMSEREAMFTVWRHISQVKAFCSTGHDSSRFQDPNNTYSSITGTIFSAIFQPHLYHNKRQKNRSSRAVAFFLDRHPRNRGCDRKPHKHQTIGNTKTQRKNKKDFSELQKSTDIAFKNTGGVREKGRKHRTVG